MDRDLKIYKDSLIVLWGAGRCGKEIVREMQKHGLDVYAFCDNDPTKWGDTWTGIPIISPEKLCELQNHSKDKELLVQIANSPFEDNWREISELITQQLEDMGITRFVDSEFAFETVFFQTMVQELGISSDQGEVVLEEYTDKSKRKKYFQFYENGFRKLMRQDHLEWFVLNIVDHCNLNCQRCDHFSTLADPYFVKVNAIDNDLKQMSKILNQRLDFMKIEGGEVFLHPELIEILQVVRKHFQNTKILLLTNGLLLLKQGKEFWDCCRENNIVLSVTKYPVNFDYDKAKKVALDNQVEYDYFSGDVVVKSSYKLSLDEKGKQNPQKSFVHCHRANSCSFLMEGKFYICPVIYNSKYLNQKLGTDFTIEDGDFIDIYKIDSPEVFTNHISKPSPFCRYCASLEDAHEIPWAVSNYSADEWLI
ncbi:MAG: hypothetical protein R3Y07_00270 [Eubacteriales bacterium]